MGDRANVKVIDGNSEVYLYTHWRGHELPQILQLSLQRGKDRWDDGPYLSRIIFCDMINTGENYAFKDLKGETGFGISSVIGDGTDRVLIVNISDQSVSYGGKRKISFTDYVKNSYKPEW